MQQIHFIYAKPGLSPSTYKSLGQLLWDLGKIYFKAGLKDLMAGEQPQPMGVQARLTIQLAIESELRDSDRDLVVAWVRERFGNRADDRCLGWFTEDELLADDLQQLRDHEAVDRIETEDWKQTS